MIQKLDNLKLKIENGYYCWSLLALCNLFNLNYSKLETKLNNLEIVNDQRFMVVNYDNNYYLSALVCLRLFTTNSEIISYFTKIAIKEELTSDIIELDCQKEKLLKTLNNLKKLNYYKSSWQQDIDNQGYDYLKTEIKNIVNKKRVKIKQYFEE